MKVTKFWKFQSNLFQQQHRGKMRYLKLLFIILALFLVSCAGEDGKGGDNVPYDPGTVIVTNPSGRVEAAFCLGYSNVFLTTLDAQLSQTGNSYRGETNADNTGSYVIPAEISDPWSQYDFEGYCRRETESGTVNVKMKLITPTSPGEKYINYPGTIQSFVATDYYNNPGHPDFGNMISALVTAKAAVLNYFDMPNTVIDFHEMSLQGTSEGDAVGAFISSIIDKDKLGYEQSDFIKRIATGIVNNNLTLKSEVAAIANNLPIVDILNNIDNMLIELGLPATRPPIWRLGAPAYYADLLERTPIVTGTFNLDDTTRCYFDQSTFNTFAVPSIFDSSIAASKYIALNFPSDSQISIWTIGVDGNLNPAPGTKLIDVTGLKEIILDTPVKLSYNGLLPVNHGLLGGVEYYIKIRKDENFTLSKSCGGRRLYTAYTLASNDEGSTWIGHGNNAAKFFYFEGIRGYTTN